VVFDYKKIYSYNITEPASRVCWEVQPHILLIDMVLQYGTHLHFSLENKTSICDIKLANQGEG